MGESLRRFSMQAGNSDEVFKIKVQSQKSINCLYFLKLCVFFSLNLNVFDIMRSVSSSIEMLL